MSDQGRDLPDAVLSERLRNALYTYDLDGDILVNAIRLDITTPSRAWFPDEFEAALLSGAFTPTVWGSVANYNGGLHEDDWGIVDMDLREIWQAIHSDRPYPLDEREGV